jgi:predicted permease
LTGDSLAVFLGSLGGTFAHVLLPILLLVGLGALVQRFHPLEIATLSKLQIYLFVPTFLFVRVVESTLSWGQIAGVAGAVLLAKLLLGLPLWLLLRRLNVPPPTLAVFILAAVIFNAGNFGIPLAERAFGREGGSVQALVVMVSNLATWIVGYALLAFASGGGRADVLGYFRLPTLYVLAVAFLLRGFDLPCPTLCPTRCTWSPTAWSRSRS